MPKIFENGKFLEVRITNVKGAKWSGHESIKTTERCAHVSEKNINNFKNPIDDLI